MQDYSLKSYNALKLGNFIAMTLLWIKFWSSIAIQMLIVFLSQMPPKGNNIIKYILLCDQTQLWRIQDPCFHGLDLDPNLLLIHFWFGSVGMCKPNLSQISTRCGQCTDIFSVGVGTFWGMHSVAGTLYNVTSVKIVTITLGLTGHMKYGPT